MMLDDILPLLAREPSTEVDPAEVALLLAQEEYPDTDVEAILGVLDAVAHDVRPRLVGPLAARTAALARHLFHDEGFRGNADDYYDPRNSYFNQVLERRLGLPITLSLVAVAVGCRAGLEVAGIGLPGHFIACAIEGDDRVLFDPFHGGRLLTPPQCEVLVERVTGRRFFATPEAMAPVTTHAFVTRMLMNLKNVYQRRDDHVRAVRIIGRLRQLLPDDAPLRRDLGVVLLRSGRSGAAIEHLAAYLGDSPGAPDETQVRDLLRQARDDVAKWN